MAWLVHLIAVSHPPRCTLCLTVCCMSLHAGTDGLAGVSHCSAARCFSLYAVLHCTLCLTARCVSLQAGTELAWLVCRSSVLNAEELARSDGLKVLGRLVQRWVDTPAARALLSAGILFAENVNLVVGNAA